MTDNEKLELALETLADIALSKDMSMITVRKKAARVYNMLTNASPEDAIHT